MHYDVFNGDADGIIALLQLRWAEPKESQLITGVKRDIQLLEFVTLQSDVTSVTVLDVSLDKNRAALDLLLDEQVPVFYCDHHKSGELPTSVYLDSLIKLDAETCTSLLINEKLGGKYKAWTIAAAFGDNMLKAGKQLAKELSLTPEQTSFLKQLGVLINYNGYGAEPADLHFHPADLYRALYAYSDPFELQSQPASPFYYLQQAYKQDWSNVVNLEPQYHTDAYKVYVLPNEPWAIRVSGIFGNEQANRFPDHAIAVLSLNKNETHYTVSMRAPLNNRFGADEVCCQFPTGGGRRAAAGINALPKEEMLHFIEVLSDRY